MTSSIARASVLLLVSALPLTLSAQGRPSTQFFYDYNGNITMSVDALNRPTHAAYDPLNRVNQMTLPVPGPFQGNPRVQLERNGQDAITKVTDPRGLVTSYAVSGLGDLSSRASPDTGVTNRTFDSNGRLASQTDARGRTVAFDYDPIGRVTRARYDDGTASLFYYDESANAIGHLSRVVDPGPITTNWTYDTNGRVLSKTQVVGSGSTVPIQAVVYSYVPGTSKLASIKYPSGKTVAYSYNATTKELESVTLDGQPIATGVVFHALGDVKQMVLGNGLVWSSELDIDGRMTGYTLAGQQYRVTWDAANRVTSIVNTADPFWDRSFGYDNLDRITSFTSTPRSQTFVYDLSGNLTAKGDVINGELANYTYYIDPLSNRMTQIASLGIAYSHDAAGNRTGDGRLSFLYDARGRMSRTVVTSGALTETFDYLYNAIGQRVRKLDAAGALIFLYDEHGRLLGEYDEAGLPQSEHVWIDGRPVAVVDYLYGGKKPKKEKKKVRDNKKDKGTQTTEIFYVETDHLLTPRMITDAAKARRWYWHSAPYGDTAPNEDPAAKGVVEYNLRFPGQYYDAETSLHYNWNRDYETTSGRYIQSDPIGLAGGLNTYSYVNGMPLASIDPTGLAACLVLFPKYPVDTGYGFAATWLGGHGGVVSYDSQGSTRYYEYGRYSPSSPNVIGDKRPQEEGNVRRVPIPDLVIDPKTLQPTAASLEALRDALSKRAGQDTPAVLTCDRGADEKKVNKYAEDFANDKNRPPYQWQPWASNHCRDFAERAFRVGK